MRRNLFIMFRVIIGVGLLIYLGYSDAIEWSSLFRLVKFRPLAFIALLLLGLIVLMTAWRLCLLLKTLNIYLSMASSIRLTLTGAFFSTFLPGTTGGDLVKIYYATRNNTYKITEISTIILLDRIFGFLALTILPLLLMPLYFEFLKSTLILRYLLWASTSIAVFILLSLIILPNDHFRKSRILIWYYRSMPLGKYLKRILDTVHAVRYNVATLLLVFGISLIVQIILVITILLLIKITNPSKLSLIMTLLIPLGFIANALPITPGGLGVGEMAFDQLFRLAGLDGGATALIGWRLLTTLIDISGLFFFIQGRKAFKIGMTKPSLKTPHSAGFS